MKNDALKYKIVKEIRIKYSPEIIKILKENNINYEIFEIKDFTPFQTIENIEEHLPLVEIKVDYYNDLKMLSEITGITMKTMVNSALFSFFDCIKNQPEAFLEDYFGDLNLIEIFRLIYKEKYEERLEILIIFFFFLFSI